MQPPTLFSPGSTISSPVAMTATCGRRATGAAAALPDIIAGPAAAPDPHPSPRRLGVLDHHHCVRPLRQGGPGHDPDGFAGPDGLASDPPGREVLDDHEFDTVASFGDPGVGRTDGVSVHGRLGERRDVFRRLEISRQASSQPLDKGNGFGGQGSGPGDDLTEGGLILNHVVS